jgi:menaquinone-9 beta-reductase
VTRLENGRSHFLGTSIYDAIVVGAGPAGCVAANHMARSGLKVLLLEKERFPRDKPCGDLIGFRAFEILNEEGICPDLPASGVSYVEGFAMAGLGNRTATARISPSDKDKRGVLVPRRDFDHAVAGKLAGHVELIEGFAVSGLEFTGAQVTGVLGSANGHEEKLRARLVVGADGANSVVARQSGLMRQENILRGSAMRAYYSGVESIGPYAEFYVCPRFLPGYMWIFAFSDGTANVGVGMFQQRRNQAPISLRDMFAAFLKEHEAVRRRLERARPLSPFKGLPLPLYDPRGKRSGPGVLLVGDAGAFVDPVSGEGIAPAMESARIAAQVAVDSLSRGSDARQSLCWYDLQWRAYFRKRFALGTLMRRVCGSQFVLRQVMAKAEQDDSYGNIVADILLGVREKQAAIYPSNLARTFLPGFRNGRRMSRV